MASTACVHPHPLSVHNTRHRSRYFQPCRKLSESWRTHPWYYQPHLEAIESVGAMCGDSGVGCAIIEPKSRGTRLFLHPLLCQKLQPGAETSTPNPTGYGVTLRGVLTGVVARAVSASASSKLAQRPCVAATPLNVCSPDVPLLKPDAVLVVSCRTTGPLHARRGRFACGRAAQDLRHPGRLRGAAGGVGRQPRLVFRVVLLGGGFLLARNRWMPCRLVFCV